MSEFKLPETLDGLSVADLQALIDGGLDALRALGITEDTTDEAVLAEGEAIAAALDQLVAAQTERQAKADRAKALATRSVPTPAPAKASDAPAPEPEPEPEPEPAPEGEPAAPDAEAVTPELVPASAASPARRAAAVAAGKAPIAPKPRAGTATLTAAADVPGMALGQVLEDGLDSIGQALIARMRGMPTSRVAGAQRQRYGAALVKFDGYGDLTQDATKDDVALVWAAGNEKRLPGGNLIAAGGWCAPSETLYDLCQYETVDGILSLPEFNVTRGGIRWTEGPSFMDIYNACGFFLTEQEAIDGTADKSCCMVECPPFDEIRMDAVGLCITAPLLTLSQYPELVRRFSEGAIVAHAHQVNKRVLDWMMAAAPGGTTIPSAGSIGVSLQRLEILAVHMRYQYRMSQTATIEVVAPYWLKPLIRADRALTAFGGDEDLTDAQIDAWFAARNLAVQWVYDFQDLTGTVCTPTIPSTATLLMYPAGTWVRGNADVINIDAVYDAASLAQNIYTATFLEQGILAVQKCTHTCRVVIETCVSGLRGAAGPLSCLAAPTALSGAGTAVTRAIAGTPGVWEPDSGTIPTSPATLASASPAIAADPTSAWTDGQYVQTGTAGAGGRAYWNGTAWVAGVAP